VTVDVGAAVGTAGLPERFRTRAETTEIMTEPAQLLPHAERLRTMARVARGVAARVAQQADKKRLEGYAENLERQASNIVNSANRQAGRGASH
jgi:hypothetical protein